MVQNIIKGYKNNMRIRLDDIFCSYNMVTIGGINVSINNISDFNFIKLWDDNKQTIYKPCKKADIVIVHDKSTDKVDWFDDKVNLGGYDGFPDEY